LNAGKIIPTNTVSRPSTTSNETQVAPEREMVFMPESYPGPMAMAGWQLPHIAKKWQLL
jgi:hypothetical protein